MALPRRIGANQTGPIAMVPTDEQRHLVQVLVGMQVPKTTIARLMPGGPISLPTLNHHFGNDLLDGKEVLIASIKHDIVKAAKRGSVRAQTWLLEHLDPHNFGKRVSQEDAPSLVPVVSDAKVEIYLPDNKRSLSDVSPVTMFDEPPLIDAEIEKEGTGK